MPRYKSFLTLLVMLALAGSVQAGEVIDIETLFVGDAGNVGELSGFNVPGGDGPDAIVGGVAYSYSIGKYEVTNSQYAAFLNSAATVGDPHGLYSADMGGGWQGIGGISRSGMGTGADPWMYATRPNRGNRPVNYVGWYDALRFANWMHNGQDSGDTEDGAYDMSLGSHVTRKAGATWALSSEDEWYKAAYYDPNKPGGAGYWDYPTQSDTLPSAEPAPGTDMTNGSANYLVSGGYQDATYYTTEVGSYAARPSDSAYGTFDQGGNVWEWNEADLFGDGSFRGARGGSFFYFVDIGLHGAGRYGMTGAAISDGGANFGFRVAQIPEPTTLTLLAFGSLALIRRRR